MKPIFSIFNFLRGLKTTKFHEVPSGTAIKMYGKDVDDNLVEDDVPSGGATAFTELSDVPQSYTDQASKMLVVNEDENALVFQDVPEMHSHFNKTTTTTASGTTVYTDSDLTFEIGAFEKWHIHCQLNFYVPANQELYVRLKDHLLDSELEWRGNWYDRTTSGTDAGPLIAVPDITIGGFGGSMIYTPIASARKIAIIIDGVINASVASTPSTIELDWSADTGAQLLKYSTMRAVRL
jgi:hypothetical protein